MSDRMPDVDRARHDLYEIMKADRPFEEKAEAALGLGEDYLDVENGHLAKVDPETDYWEAIASTDGPDGAFPPGLVLDYSKTYCRRTVANSDPVALHDAPNQGLEDDPAFEEHGVHCYHGTTITIEEETYGTVCFVSTEPRGEPFSDEETMFAELIARMLEHELRHRQVVAKLDRLDRFTSVLSHDLRNPLNVARGRIDVARQSVDSEHLDVAVDALDRMEELITDVLAMARHGREVNSTEAVSVSDIAEDAWESVETPDAVFVVDDDVTIRADPERVQQLFENLYRNSVEHGSSMVGSGFDEERDQIRVRVGPLEREAGFYVADDGRGIPESKRETVFEHGYSTSDEGTGLGLAIVEGIADAHGWRVSVTESADGGARFEISDVMLVDSG